MTLKSSVTSFCMRAFVAIDIAPELRGAIVDLQQRLAEPGLRLVEPANLHITLKFLGEIDETKLPEIISRLSSIRAAPFEIELGGLGAFPSPRYIRVVWIGIVNGARLARLAEAVAASLPEFGRKERFSGHLTICRVKTRPRQLPKKFEQFKDVTIGKQLVDCFCLKRSELKPAGPVYSNLAVFPLVG